MELRKNLYINEGANKSVLVARNVLFIIYTSCQVNLGG